MTKAEARAMAKILAKELFDDMNDRSGFDTSDLHSSIRERWLTDWEDRIFSRLSPSTSSAEASDPGDGS